MSKYASMLNKSASDEWHTLCKDVEPIVPYLRGGGYKKILCPFDTEKSAFVKVLTERGFDVSYSHLSTGTDFFKIDNFAEYDAIVSNPPFSKRDEIFKALFGSGVPFAVIMNFNGLFDSKMRYELFSSNEFEIIVPKGRMRFVFDGDIKKSPSFQSVWICKGITNKQIEFMDGDCDG